MIIKALEYDLEDVKTKSDNSYSKFAIALQKEIERRKHNKKPIKFGSNLQIALKEVINRRRKMRTN
jgi:BRCT domain type II-containing protein